MFLLTVINVVHVRFAFALEAAGCPGCDSEIIITCKLIWN